MLLQRFLTHRDSAAFEALVRRHGPRVLAVCRRLLPDADAEDAFQATFLCLLRQAKSIRERRNLRGWLLTVAHRVAMRLLWRAKARRERGAIEVASAPVDLSWREACVILHEEVDRLPERFRLPVVLCYFEGFSRDEAAEQLGWSAGMVKGRLERGREALKSRLTRRGIALSAGALTFAGADSVASIPAVLVQLTLDLASGGRVKPALAALLPVTRSAALRRTAVVAGLMLVVGVGAIAGGRPKPDVARAMPADPPAKPADTTTVRGKVVGPDGKPFAGAKLSLDGEKDLGVSGADGGFEVSVPHAALGSGKSLLLAIAKNHGAGWMTLPVPGGEIALRLAKDDLPIRGRIVDLEGKPLAHIDVKANLVIAPIAGDLMPFLRDQFLKDGPRSGLRDQPKILQLNEAVAARLASTTTGTDGRFELLGLGRDRIVNLRISGAGIQQATLRVATIENVPPASAVWPGMTLYAPSFEYAALPGRTVRGVIRDVDSGEPLVGVVVQSTGGAQVRTDALGRYELSGFPKSAKASIFVNPADQTHFMTRVIVPDQAGLGPTAADAALKRGIPFHGHVMDHTTGKPVAARVRYYAIYPNPHVRKLPGGDVLDGFETLSVTTKPDGSFTVGVLPGPGAVVVTALRPGYQSALVDPQKFFGAAARPGSLDYGNLNQISIQLAGSAATLDEQAAYQGIVLLNPAGDAGPITREIALEPAVPVSITLLDPEGKPLAGARVLGLSYGVGWDVQMSADIVLQGWNPRRPKLLEFRHEERKLLGYVELIEATRSPVTVTLKPWGEISGRLVRPDGKPIGGVSLFAAGSDSPNIRAIGVRLGSFRTDTEGSFHVDGLTPGVEYKFSYRTLRPPLHSGTFPDGITLKPGESRDLGDVRVKPKLMD